MSAVFAPLGNGQARPLDGDEHDRRDHDLGADVLREQHALRAHL